MSWVKSHPIIAALFFGWSILWLWAAATTDGADDLVVSVIAYSIVLATGALGATILTLISNQTFGRLKRERQVKDIVSVTSHISRPVRPVTGSDTIASPRRDPLKSELDDLKRRVAANEEKVTRASWSQHYAPTVPNHSAQARPRPTPTVIEQPRGSTITLKEILRYTPAEFEEFCAKALNSMGYQGMKVNGGAGDLQADIIGKDSHGRSTVVQCKRYKPGSKIGTPVIQTFIGMMSVHHRADRGIFMTTAGYSTPAIKLAQQHDIVLIDGDDLVKIAGLVFAPRPEARPRYQVRFCSNCGSEIEGHEVRFCAECGQPIQRQIATAR